MTFRPAILLGSLTLAASVWVAFSCSAPDPVTPVDDAATEKTPPPKPDAGLGGPEKLSETGLYADIATRTLAAGVIEFSVRYPLWSDGSEKRRFLFLPEGSKIDTANMDFWDFPVGTKAWKQFIKDGKLVETRLLWKKPDGLWFEVAYAWLADETDAVAAPTGVKAARGTTHDIPEQVKCKVCHDNVADTLIGLDAFQLSDGAGSGFLTTLAKAGRLTVAPAGEFEIPGTGNVKGALGYLHGNCGGCHNDNAKFEGQTSLRLRVLTTETTVDKTGVYRTAFGLKMIHEIPPDVFDALVAGDPAKSGIYVRMIRRDGYGMPPQCTKEVDVVGSTLIKDWITGMSADAGSD